jgi:hypothetical protein
LKKKRLSLITIERKKLRWWWWGRDVKREIKPEQQSTHTTSQDSQRVK